MKYGCSAHPLVLRSREHSPPRLLVAGNPASPRPGKREEPTAEYSSGSRVAAEVEVAGLLSRRKALGDVRQFNVVVHLHVSAGQQLIEIPTRVARHIADHTT